MSEPIPESIPTSSDPRSKRPTKRRALGPVASQAASITSLFANPARPITLPPPVSAVPSKPAIPPPPEIVANVQGSSAGAGSGEFHVYKASRRREYERVRLMEEDMKREEEDEQFVQRREDWKRKDDERTEKKRRRREKARGRAKGKAPTQGGDRGEVRGDAMDVAATDGDKHGEETEKTKNVAEDVGVVIHDDD